MSQPRNVAPEDEMRAEYDFSGGTRGKYLEQYGQGMNIVVLDPDVADVFRDSDAVNDALRLLMSIARKQLGKSDGTDSEDTRSGATS